MCRQILQKEFPGSCEEQRRKRGSISRDELGFRTAAGVKPGSPNHRFVIALHSPDGEKPEYPARYPVKRTAKPARILEQDTFSV
jgi:hypothetical protein